MDKPVGQKQMPGDKHLLYSMPLCPHAADFAIITPAFDSVAPVYIGGQQNIVALSTHSCRLR